MVERYDLPKIKPNRRPSIFNWSAVEGAWWGSWIGDIAEFVTSLETKNSYESRRVARTAAYVGSTLTGFIFGGILGKRKQEAEQKEGMVVSDPSYWNHGLEAGALLGLICMPGGFSFNLFEGLPWSAWLAGTAAAMVAGSVIKKHWMDDDFNQAIALRTAQQQGQTQAQTPGLYKNVTTPEEMQKLQAISPTKAHTQALEGTREHAMPSDVQRS